MVGGRVEGEGAKKESETILFSPFSLITTFCAGASVSDYTSICYGNELKVIERSQPGEDRFN